MISLSFDEATKGYPLLIRCLRRMLSHSFPSLATLRCKNRIRICWQHIKGWENVHTPPMLLLTIDFQVSPQRSKGGWVRASLRASRSTEREAYLTLNYVLRSAGTQGENTTLRITKPSLLTVLWFFELLPCQDHIVPSVHLIRF